VTQTFGKTPICKKTQKAARLIIITRVARWFVFKPKIPICVYIFWRALEWKMDIFYVHLEYLKDIWDIL
jgi:hypothetical protein